MKNFAMSISILLWCTCQSHSVPELNRSRSRRVKRIVDGEPLRSHDDYNTQFVVSIQETFSCVSAQLTHVMEDCNIKHHCGGSLIAPDFVLTACHCMVYEHFYTNVPLPEVKWIDPSELRASNDFLEGLSSFFSKPEPLHPVLNAMTVWAGSVYLDSMPQKRHGKAFFPHSLCMQRLKLKYPRDWKHQFEMDVGVIQTCEKFYMQYKELKLAPILHGYMLQNQLKVILNKGTVCLYLGWGSTKSITKGFKNERPNALHHTFRYVQCCGDPKKLGERNCTLCSYHIGPKMSHPEVGDSGSPIICDKYQVALVTKGGERLTRNITFHKDFAIACVKDYITSYHLDYLRKLHQGVFHWMGGSPVPMTAEKKKRKTFYQRFRSFDGYSAHNRMMANEPSLNLPFMLLIMIFIY